MTLSIRMTSSIRNRASTVCALGILGACLMTGCGHNDAAPAGTSGPASAAGSPAMPSGMPPEARQQTLQAEGGASPAALAAEHNAAVREAAMKAAKH